MQRIAAIIIVTVRADNASHFVTRDPWASARPWHESITTTHESW